MAWLNEVIDLLSSREWLLTMMVVIVTGAFLFPDYHMGEGDKDDVGNKENRD